VPARVVLIEGKEIRLPAEDAEELSQRINRARGDLVAIEREGVTVWVNPRSIVYVEDANNAPLVAGV
jgi:hypothetical protein